MLRNRGSNFEPLMEFNSAKIPWEKIREAGCTSAGSASLPQVCRDVNSKKTALPSTVHQGPFLCPLWIAGVGTSLWIRLNQIRNPAQKNTRYFIGAVEREVDYRSFSEPHSITVKPFWKCTKVPCNVCVCVCVVWRASLDGRCWWQKSGKERCIFFTF